MLNFTILRLERPISLLFQNATHCFSFTGYLYNTEENKYLAHCSLYTFSYTYRSVGDATVKNSFIIKVQYNSTITPNNNIEKGNDKKRENKKTQQTTVMHTIQLFTTC